MQSENLQIAPIGVNPTVYASQYDFGRTITFKLYDGSSAYSLDDDVNVKVEGIKSDGNGFSYECDFSDNTVTVELTSQMTVLAETVPCEIRVYDSEYVYNIGTLNFNLVVEPSPISGEVDISDTELPAIIALAREQQEAAEASAEAAATSEENAGTSETNAETYALKSEGYAVGTQNEVEVTSGTYFENNSKYYCEQAADSATAAAESESNAADSAAAALVSEQNAKESEEIIELYVDFVVPRFTIANNRLYLKDTSTLSFLVQNNRLYIQTAS